MQVDEAHSGKSEDNEKLKPLVDRPIVQKTSSKSSTDRSVNIEGHEERVGDLRTRMDNRRAVNRKMGKSDVNDQMYLTRAGREFLNEKVQVSTGKSDIGGARSMTRAGMAPSPHTRSRTPGRANVAIGNRTKEPTGPIDGEESPKVPYADQNKAINIASQRANRLPSGRVESGLNKSPNARRSSTLTLTLPPQPMGTPRLIRKTSDVDKEQRMTDKGANPYAPGRILGTGRADPLATTADQARVLRRQISRYKKMDAYEAARKSGTTMHKPIMDPQVRRVPGNIAHTRERWQPPAETPAGHQAANTPQIKAKTMEKRGTWRVNPGTGRRIWIDREMIDRGQKDFDAEVNKVRRDA